MVIKFDRIQDHVADLGKAFERMRKHGLKMNPKKCAFGVSDRKLLGLLVYQRGIELDKIKTRAIIEAQPPKNKKEL